MRVIGVIALFALSFEIQFRTILKLNFLRNKQQQIFPLMTTMGAMNEDHSGRGEQTNE